MALHCLVDRWLYPSFCDCQLIAWSVLFEFKSDGISLIFAPSDDAARQIKLQGQFIITCLYAISVKYVLLCCQIVKKKISVKEGLFYSFFSIRPLNGRLLFLRQPATKGIVKINQVNWNIESDFIVIDQKVDGYRFSTLSGQSMQPWDMIFFCRIDISNAKYI